MCIVYFILILMIKTYILHSFRALKSDNLQYDMVGCWVDLLINLASEGPSMYYFYKLKINQWVAVLDLGHSKLLFSLFVKLWSFEKLYIKKKNWKYFWILQEIMK